MKFHRWTFANWQLPEEKRDREHNVCSNWLKFTCISVAAGLKWDSNWNCAKCQRRRRAADKKCIVVQGGNWRCVTKISTCTRGRARGRGKGEENKRRWIASAAKIITSNYLPSISISKRTHSIVLPAKHHFCCDGQTIGHKGETQTDLPRIETNLTLKGNRIIIQRTITANRPCCSPRLDWTG